jgi:hypothetical protein
MKNYDKILNDIYRRLYEESTPSVNWEELKVSEEAKQDRFFLNYEIPEEVYDKILEEEINKHKLMKYQKQLIRNTICLGCSPKFKK